MIKHRDLRMGWEILVGREQIYGSLRTVKLFSVKSRHPIWDGEPPGAYEQTRAKKRKNGGSKNEE